MIIRPSIFNNKNIVAAQSTRLGGVSQAPYFSMNLGLSVNDEKENVIKNRELFFGNLGIELSQLVMSKQVHGNKVYVANTPIILGEGFDALITNEPGTFLAISVADCTPILIYDFKNNSIAAIHAGWNGTSAEIVKRTLQKMNENYGTKGFDCKAFIGACIGYENFEVGNEVAEQFDVDFKRFDAQKQKYYIDLKGANKKQLLDFGLSLENIEVSPYCTFKNEELFFSHRRDKGVTGRMIAVIGISFNTFHI